MIIHNKTHYSLILVLVIAATAVALVSVKVDPIKDTLDRERAIQSAAPASRDGDEVEVVDVTPLGFEPSRIRRPRGAFILAVHNHSGESQLLLRLDRVQGGRLHQVRMGRGRRVWDQPLDLQAGDYILSEASHPNWQCRITLSE